MKSGLLLFSGTTLTRGKGTLMEFYFYPGIQRLLHPDSTSSTEPEFCTQIIARKGAKWGNISYCTGIAMRKGDRIGSLFIICSLI